VGKIIFRGPAGSKAFIDGATLKPGEEMNLPMEAIPEGCINSKDYEVFDDAGGEVKGKSKSNKPKVGEARIGSKEKEKEIKKKDKEVDKEGES